MNIQKAFGFEQKEIQVRGKKYTLQNMPFRAFYQLQEKCKDQYGNVKPSAMYDEFFKNVIVAPKVSWENFTNIDEIEELMKEVFNFLTSEKPSETEK